MINTVRGIMLVGIFAFAVMALIHSGGLVPGHEHAQARIAEGIIALVLVMTLALTWLRRGQARTFAAAGTAFALIGTFVGLVMIAIGVGPHSTLDLVFHPAIMLLLIFGLATALRVRSRSVRSHV